MGGGWLHGRLQRSMTRDELVSALQSHAGMEFTGVDARVLMGPIVYLLFRGERVLYVGMSQRGLLRPLDRRHRALKDLKDNDRLQVWPLASVTIARAVESALIERLQPEWNRVGVRSVLTQALSDRLGIRPQRLRTISRPI